MKRRKLKTEGKGRPGLQEEIKAMNANFQRQARKDKESAINNMCKELEDEDKIGRTRNVYQKLKEITGHFTARIGSLKKKERKVLTKEEEMKQRWREYTENLYRRDSKL